VRERSDRGKTYTIGFSHPAMHNSTTEMCVWCYYDNIGLEKIELTPIVAATRDQQLQALRETFKAGLRPDATLGYVFVALRPGFKSFVMGSPLWKVIKDCQTSESPTI